MAASLAVAARDNILVRMAAVAIAPLCVFGVFLTLSRGGLVALAAAGVAMVAVGGRWRWATIGLLVVAMACTLVYFNAFVAPEARERVTTLEGGTGRTDVWTVGWRMVEAEPVRGIGNGNFPNTSVHYLLEPGALTRTDFIVDTPKVAHNMYLEVLAELGVIGMALFLGILLLLAGVRGQGHAGLQGVGRPPDGDPVARDCSWRCAHCWRPTSSDRASTASSCGCCSASGRRSWPSPGRRSRPAGSQRRGEPELRPSRSARCCAAAACAVRATACRRTP